MSLTRYLLPALAIAALLAGCEETDPSKPATWVAHLGDKDPKVVADALDHLRTLKAKDSVPQILPLLKSDEGSVREAAAAALEDIGEVSAVQPLIDAADLGTSDPAINQANLKIADALGTLGDKRATPTLVKMLKSRADLLRVRAAEALDKIKDPASIPELIPLVANETTAMLVNKFAIVALGDMQAKEAIPELLKALVYERQGISLYVEASYALFQIGAPAIPALVAITDGSDKAYVVWATSAHRAAAGYVSKAIVVLGDIGDPSAVPALVALLKWQDPGGNGAWNNLVRANAAQALGRLRATDAAGAVAAALPTIDDANMRALIAQALAHIGDPKQIPKMEAAIKNTRDTWTDRSETLKGLALLGDAAEKPFFDAFLAAETSDKAIKTCLADESDDTGDTKQARCKKEADERGAFIREETTRLMEADQCKTDVPCWAGKLKDPSEKWKERAAFQLGESGAAAAVDPLVAACKDDSTVVRDAAYIALDWLSRADAAKAALKAKAGDLAAQLVAEKSSAKMHIVNEDLRRVVWKLQHL